MKEKEVKTGNSGKCKLGKWNVLAPSNVSLKPRQIQTWQMRSRWGEVDPQVDRSYVRLKKKYF